MTVHELVPELPAVERPLIGYGSLLHALDTQKRLQRSVDWKYHLHGPERWPVVRAPQKAQEIANTSGSGIGIGDVIVAVPTYTLPERKTYGADVLETITVLEQQAVDAICGGKSKNGVPIPTAGGYLVNGFVGRKETCSSNFPSTCGLQATSTHA